MFSLCALFFGPHTDLAQRLVDSWNRQPPAGQVADVRLGLNAVAPATYMLLHDWAGRTARAWRVPVRLYLPEGNTLKYPTMRRMFFDPAAPLAPAVMWFDDDSYLDGTNPRFWTEVDDQLGTHALVGQYRWFKFYQGQGLAWVRHQPWCRHFVDRKAQFCTGGWWALRRFVIDRYDYPWPELRHKGGDMLLSELCRQQDLPIGCFDTGVRINADAAGRHSKAERRGRSQGSIERELGYAYQGQPLPTDHQNFRLTVEHFAPS